jgi:hypothetical protein
VRRDRVESAAPSADVALAVLPQCHKAWEGGRVARELARSTAALARFGSAENRRVASPVGLDGARWTSAVETALKTPVEDAGRSVFPVRCEDIALAGPARSRARTRACSTRSRGAAPRPSARFARWRADQVVEVSSRQVARANPWAGLPGCVYLHANDASSRYFVAGARGLDESLCAPATPIAGEPTADLAPGDARWRVPPSLAAMLAPLEPLHRPAGALYRTTSRAHPSRVALAGGEVDVGYAIELTIDPDVQALAQRTAACYTGRDDVCRAMGIVRKDDADARLGRALLERAMVRMAAIAIVDVETGRIEALAGALSPCTRQEHDGPGRAASCDRRLPYPIRYRPDALLNPAVFHDAMPASTIKPIMASAFLSDPVAGPRWLAAEQADAARCARPRCRPCRACADSSRAPIPARFLDRMFCGERDFAPCARPWAIQAAAGRVRLERRLCVRERVVRPPRPPVRRRAPRRAPTADRARSRSRSRTAGCWPSPPARRPGHSASRPSSRSTSRRSSDAPPAPTARRPDRDDWEKCGGGRIVDIVAEGWGQGPRARERARRRGHDGAPRRRGERQGRGEPAAPGRGGARHARRGASPRPTSRPSVTGIARGAAEVILGGLTFGHRGGTSRGACEQVFTAEFCARMDWIAGKTGTPTFPNDDRSLDELARLCAPGVAKTKAERAACGPLRPYKWYVAAYRTDPANPRWTKAIAVLAERNWIADTGRIHGAGDHGPNPGRRDRDADRGAPRGRDRMGAQVKPARANVPIGGPLVWAFDGPLAQCLADVEDALRRAIVQVGDVASIAVMLELSLPALDRRVRAGDRPAAGVDRIRRAPRRSLWIAADAARAARPHRRTACHARHCLPELDHVDERLVAG